MTIYGGMGGIRDGRPLNRDDAFEMAVHRALGEEMKTDDDLCEEVWAALANVDWRHENGDEAGYSWRAAGDLVAAVRGRGHYVDWYCCREEGVVSDRVSDALAAEGWRPIRD